MRVEREARYTFHRATNRYSLMDFLRQVPRNASITVRIDHPANPTPVDPGGTVIISATWKDDLDLDNPGPKDCPHAAPHRYCGLTGACAVSPCPIGMDGGDSDD